jgi:hypothetical protein
MSTCIGGCHCGRIKFEVEIPESVTVHRCNCSICRKSGYLHLIVAKKYFKLLCGEENLVDYRFHTGTARHLFCGECGIKSFYVPRSHPESFSVNLNCVDLPDEINVTVEAFDGRNWSENREKLVKTETDEDR